MTRLALPVRPLFPSFLVPLLAATFVAGCGNSVTALSSHDGGGGSTGSAGGSGSAGSHGTAGNGSGTAGNGSGTAGAPDLGVDAGGKIPVGQTECTDGIDNDHDGKIDSADFECTGPNDDDEGSFATGIPGDNIDACKQDCFFDGNSGMGDDGCQWQLECDPKSTNTKCPYDPSYVDKHAAACSVSASQSDKCITNCRKYVPNGCDCFGCCVVPGAATPIRLEPTCTAKDFGDPTKCSACTQVSQCANPCERCELCVGKDTVPADCGSTPPDGGTDASPPPDGGYGKPTCSGGVSCTPGAGTGGCPDGYGCVTGCCLPVIP